MRKSSGSSVAGEGASSQVARARSDKMKATYSSPPQAAGSPEPPSGELELHSGSKGQGQDVI